ncbi:MAG TPA: hypothetical protein VJR91_11635, partial [Burkholderia sp.]|nr:hypothetical protein [Burkholderia sp.]
MSTGRAGDALWSQCVSICRGEKARAKPPGGDREPGATDVPMRMPRIFTGTFDFFSAKGRTMKKTLASIMTAAFALASVSAFAQASAP